MKKKKKDKPKWLMSYSLICLTNLPDLIRRYGPLRLYWEGGGLGEKVLQKLKLLWLGFRKNWQEKTLKDIYQQGELTRITEEQRNEKKNSGAKMLHIYSDYITARNTLLQNKPMSVIQSNYGMLCIAFSLNNDGSFSVVPLVLEIFLFQRMGVTYFLVVPYFDGIRHGIKSLKLKKYCVSLPELVPTGLPQLGGSCFFTFITSDWEKMNNNKSFSI
jgi:hypothetical protein